MIVSFTTVFAIAASLLAIAAVLGALGLAIARCALREAREARGSAAIATLRIAELESALADVDGRLKLLVADQERAAATPSRPGLREAVALSRHGASVEELVATCRIGQSEAKLIQMLYGSRPPAETTVADLN